MFDPSIVIGNGLESFWGLKASNRRTMEFEDGNGKSNKWVSVMGFSFLLCFLALFVDGTV